MANKTGRRMKPEGNRPPKPEVQLITTAELLAELKRRSLACLLCATVIDDGGMDNTIVETKGSPILFHSILLQAQIAVQNHYVKYDKF